MPFDFPADPTQGLEFQPPGGPLYVYNAPRWVVKTPVIVWDDITLKPTTFPPSAHTHPQAEITNLLGDMALKAPLDSPIFTGDPRSVTPATGDNDTSIATTAYVKANVALVSQFPEAPLDGKTYGRKDGGWSTVVGGATVSTTPPTGTKIQGQLWYESDSGNTYLWYEDANTQQWVQQNIQPAGLPDDGEGAGIGEAPSDGLTYGRKDLNWVLLGFAAGGAPAWEDILYKPDTFPPTLPIAQSGITNLTTDLAGKAPTVHTHTTAQVTGLDTALAGKAPTAHTHITAEVTGLDTALAGKSDTSHTHSYASLTGIPSSFLPTTHSHPQSEVTGLDTSLAGKSDTGHVHPQSDVTNLTSDLALKAPLASPAFTGTATVAGDPSTALGIATKQMVDLKMGSITRTAFTTSGTYTKPAGLKFLNVILVGGGAAGSSAALTAAANSSAGGAGGGAGTVIKLYAASALAATVAYTVGAGGVVTSGSGTAGGSTTFSGLTASGGGAPEATGVNGSASGATQVMAGSGAGGAAAGGDYNVVGGNGTHGMRVFAAVAGNALASVGGQSFMSLPSQNGMRVITTTMAGPAGRSYGGGGNGGANGVSQAAAAAGGAGGVGVIIFEEYF